MKYTVVLILNYVLVQIKLDVDLSLIFSDVGVTLLYIFQISRAP